MSATSAIEWTDATWNPVRGCTRISAGCGGPNRQGGCYAETIAARFSGPGQPFEGFAERGPHGGRWTGKLALVDEALTLPLRWKKPRRIFVNSMSDLFHENLPDEAIDKVFAVMALAPRHTFQVLTKRAKRMREYLTRIDSEPVHETARRIAAAWPGKQPIPPEIVFPLPNVWLGVSTEDQATADERIPHLLATPAAKRFISAEPLLGAIDLAHIARHGDHGTVYIDNALDGFRAHKCGGSYGAKLDWVIAGGESGRQARPAHPDWFRALRDQCATAGVPYFFKQWGAWRPEIDRDRDDPDWRRDYGVVNRKPDRFAILNLAGGTGFHGERVHLMAKHAKADNGAELDGRMHREFPT